jgi:hypothetical protein
MRRRVIAFLVLAIGVALGCNAIFGIGDYSVVASDASAAGDGPPGGEAGADCSASYDPKSGQCYPCVGTTDPELLNACTGSQCIPFDDTARTPLLGADGKLPPVPDLPPPDAGAG